MKTKRRILAVILCFCMILSYGGYTSFAADEVTGSDEYIEEYSEENNSGVTEEVSEDADEEIADDYSEDEDVANAGLSSVIEYLVIGSNSVQPGDEQFVLVGLDTDSAKDIVINYSGTSGAVYSKQADVVSDEYALFYIDTNALADDIYTFNSIDMSYQDKNVSIILADEEVYAAFGVNMSVDVTPYGWVYDENTESETDVAGVIVNDVFEGDLTKEDVSEAMNELGYNFDSVYDLVGDVEEASSVKDAPSRFVVVLDPGHGLGDTGAHYTHNGVTYYERDLNLKIALACKEELEKKGITVYMTRYDNNSLPSLTERAKIAANYGADLFVSIHNNAQSAGTAHGSEVWVPNGSVYNYYTHEVGEDLGTRIINNLAALGLNKRGVFTRNATPTEKYPNGETYPTGDISDYYTVINESRRHGIPGMIIEHAYVSNASDAINFLSSDESLRKLGVSDAQAIYSFYSSLSDDLPDGTAGVMAVADANTGIYTMVATNLSTVGGVKFKVTANATGKSIEVGSFKAADNNWYSNFAASDFANASSYTIEAYVQRKTGTYYRVGSTTVGALPEKKDETIKATISSYNADGDNTMILIAGDTKGTFGKTWFVLTSPDGKISKEYAAVKQADGRFLAFVGISDYKQSGKYTAKAYTTSGNKNVYLGETSFEISAPTAKSIDVKNINNNTGTFDIVVSGAYAKAGVASVRIPAWSKADLSDLYWYTAEKQADGTYVAHANIKNHKNSYGSYAVQAYVKASNGVETVPVSKCFTMKKPVPSIWPFDVGDNTTFIIGAENIPCGSDVAGVKVAIWHDGLSDLRWYNAFQDDLGRWLAFMNVGYDYKKAGIYYADVYATYKDGRSEELGVVLFRVVEPTASGIYVTNANNSAGTFDVVVSGVKCPSGVESVRIPVWSEANLGDIHWYNAARQADGTYKATVNINNHKGHYATYVMQAYVKSGNGIETVAATSAYFFSQSTDQLYAIEGSSNVTVNQMVSYYKKNATYPAFYAGTDAPTIEDFCRIYYEECQAEGIKAEVAFCQCMKETGFLRFGGDVKIEQFNFCGLGATGGGEPGHSFASVRLGVRAHIQHLKAYASHNALANACVDPRFSYVTRGTALYVEWLGINENPYGKGWAVALRYGYSLRNDYISKLLGR